MTVFLLRIWEIQNVVNRASLSSLGIWIYTLTMMNQKPELITEPIPYKTLFPWLNLFRVFRLAVDFQKILLAIAAILLLMLG
ncbi:MAG TPA: hypothetical protein DCM07_04540, partial [Planctomycetaceae bacterium]|nr:hypothetical protein [Planctomycetaceae bacterium]